jgi:AcrR family transcriptional regulator
MTEKQKNILDSAIQLFANEGFNAVSTRSIAQKAGVSEGLIFRHFKNKMGLLESLLKRGEERLEKTILSIEELTHPKVILKHAISIPFNMNGNQKDFWKLYYSLGCQINPPELPFLDRLKNKVITAFKALGVSDANTEAGAFMLILDGAMLLMLTKKPKNASMVFQVLINKYDL